CQWARRRGRALVGGVRGGRGRRGPRPCRAPGRNPAACVVQCPARPLRRGWLRPGPAGVAGPSLRPFRRPRLGADGQQDTAEGRGSPGRHSGREEPSGTVRRGDVTTRDGTALRGLADAEGSSVGVYIVARAANSPPQLGPEIPETAMVEQYVPGRE